MVERTKLNNSGPCKLPEECAHRRMLVSKLTNLQPA